MEQKYSRQDIVDGVREYIKDVLKGNKAIEIEETVLNDSPELSDVLKQDQWIFLSTGVQPIGHVGVNRSWIPVLSQAILNLDKSAAGEVADDLVKEFVGSMVYSQLPDYVKGDKALKDTMSVVKQVQLEKSLKASSFTILNFHVSGSMDGDDQNIDTSLFLALSVMEEQDQKSTVSLSKSLKREKAMANTATDSGTKVEFEEFRKETSVKNDYEVRNIEILKDVEMNLSVELGRKEIPLGDILKLVKGSVIELDKMAGEPVEILVNGSRIALGEVVVIDEHFGVRVSSLVSERERMKSLV